MWEGKKLKDQHIWNVSLAGIQKVQDDHVIIIMTSSTIIMIIMTVKVGLVRPRPWNNRDVWCSGALVADR